MGEHTPLIIGFEGRSLNQELKKHLLHINPAGIVFFKRNIVTLKQTKQLIGEIKDLLGDVIVSVDFEGGMVSRFPIDTPVPPSPYALNLLGDSKLIKESCRIQAELLAYLGFNLNLAPVADIYTGAENEAIGTRAFSRTPEKIAEYIRIIYEEHHALNIGTTAKHFPGQGRTITDTHVNHGEVRHGIEDMCRLDLLPFEKAVSYGVQAVMPGHLKYSNIDPERPAAMSRKIIEDLLRKQMGYDNLVITDCIEMAGISSAYSLEAIIKHGLQAGVDLWISSYSLKKSYEFQYALKHAYDQTKQSTHEIAVKVKQSQIRINRFLKNRSVVKPRFKMDENLKTLTEIHRKSIRKTRHSRLAGGYNGLSLIEISNREFSGINADSHWNVVSDVLRMRCDAIKHTTLISQCDIDAFTRALADVEKQGLVPVLLTANAFRHQNYHTLYPPLQNTKVYIHIALLDKQDLFGLADNEWVTWGFNGMTGLALAEELAVSL